VDPGACETHPGLQATQLLDCGRFWYVPGMQLVQLVVPPVEYVPSKHRPHTGSTNVVSMYRPGWARQPRKSVSPELQLKSGHVLHAE